MKFQAVILAAGKGTRMKSDKPKVLHNLAGSPMIEYVLDATKNSGIKKITLVIGFKKEEVIQAVEKWAKPHSELQIDFCVQEEQLGTGHALKVAEMQLKNNIPYLLVMLGDVPLVKSETLQKAAQEIESREAAALVITTKLDDPTGYGRILRDEDGILKGIKEQADASESEKQIKEVNTGIFIFDNRKVWNFVHQLKSANAQEEYYLTDIIELLNQSGETVLAYTAEDSKQFLGINSVENLKEIEKEVQLKL